MMSRFYIAGVVPSQKRRFDEKTLIFLTSLYTGELLKNVVVCNTINAWWLLEVAPSHPQAALEAATHQIKCCKKVEPIQ